MIRRAVAQACKVPRDSTIYSDGFRSYAWLLTKQLSSPPDSARATFAHSHRRHINGIENFWSFAETRLRRYVGNRRNHFVLHLKEMEFRFNHRHEDLLLLIGRLLKKLA